MHTQRDTDRLPDFRWTGRRRFRQDPRDAAFYDHPARLYRALHRRPGPVYWEDYGLWCLTGFEAIDACLKDDRFARLPPRPMASPVDELPSHLAVFAETERWSLLSLEGADHSRLRKRLVQAFSNRRIEALTPAITAIADDCLERMAARLENGQSVDLLTDYATPIPLLTIVDMMGIDRTRAEALLAWSHAMVRVYTMTQSRQDELLAERAATAFRDFLRAEIAQRRTRPGADLLSALCMPDAQGSRLSEAELVSLCILLLNAGHEATVHQIGNALYTLLQQDHPMQAIPVGELTRVDPPLHLFVRYAQTRVALAEDVVLAAGERVALLLGAGNHDPAKFACAHRFDAARQTQGNLAFGAGRHFCIGTTLARFEIRIAIERLRQRWPRLQLAGDCHYRDSYHFHGLETLPVRLIDSQDDRSERAE